MKSQNEHKILILILYYRERAPRELPTQVTSSEDEGPCYIDSETPAGWIKTLSEQSSNGIITNSRKDLLNDLNDCVITSCVDSESEKEVVEKKEEPRRKKKGNKKPEEKTVPVKKGPPKIPANVKNVSVISCGFNMILCD